jgi:hypothetical protein
MASLTIENPSGFVTLEIDPNAGMDAYPGGSPPPLAQNYTEERVIIVHPIPYRDGDRKEDMGRSDAELTLSGICRQDIAAALVSMVRTSNSGQHYDIVFTDDSGNGTEYTAMWIKRVGIGVRKGSAFQKTWSVTFTEQNQEDSDA